MSSEIVECRRLMYLEDRPASHRVSEKGKAPVILPKSQVDYIKRHPKAADGSQECDVRIPEWLAIDRGLSFD
jgi:hypothetical protein